MSDTTFTPEIRTAPIPARELAPWVIFGGLLMLVALYFVGVAPGEYLHEYVHDARHLLGFPCH
jgi:cobalt transporter subunit CbtB